MTSSRIRWTPTVLPLALCLLCQIPAIAQDGWVWQNPRPTGNYLFTLDFVDRWTGMAIGGFGTVMRTIDGGTTWQTFVADGLRDLPDVGGLELLDAESGIVHDWDTVFLTRDGGHSWRTILDLAGLGFAVRDCSFSSYQTISCVDQSPGFWRTVDGGVTWARRDMPTSIQALAFVSDAEGWAVGGWDTILHTADGGQTWELQDVELGDPSTWMSGVDFADEHVGVVTGRDFGLYTRDGGRTWSLSRGLECPCCIYHGFDDVRLTDSSLGVASELDGVYRTRDGGANWERVTESSFSLSSVRGSAALSESELVVAGWGGLGLTSDGGTTWESLSESFADEALNDVWFSDRLTGTAVGRAGTILRTIDGGTTWTMQDGGTDSTLISVAFHGRDSGIAAGEGVLLRTDDGGVTWSAEAGPTRPDGEDRYLRDIAYVDEGVVVAVDCCDVIVRSDDGGHTWNEQYRSPDGSAIYAVSFFDSENGRAFGDWGTVFQTSDGGHTWVPQLADQHAGFGYASFADEEVGFAVSINDFADSRIYRTEDGGKTWDFQVGVNWTLQGIHAVDREVVTVVGWGGVILRTDTGGLATGREAVRRLQDIPYVVSLEQNYPNPFNPTTTIWYELPQASDTALTVFDVLGREVQVLASGTRPAGRHEVQFDASGLPAGIYFYRIHARDYVQTKRMVVVR